MRTSDVASAYARTLFELASLADSVDQTDKGLVSAAAVVRGSLDLRTALTDASVPAETKRGVLATSSVTRSLPKRSLWSRCSSSAATPT